MVIATTKLSRPIRDARAPRGYPIAHRSAGTLTAVVRGVEAPVLVTRARDHCRPRVLPALLGSGSCAVAGWSATQERVAQRRCSPQPVEGQIGSGWDDLIDLVELEDRSAGHLFGNGTYKWWSEPKIEDQQWRHATSSSPSLILSAWRSAAMRGRSTYRSRGSCIWQSQPPWFGWARRAQSRCPPPPKHRQAASGATTPAPPWTDHGPRGRETAADSVASGCTTAAQGVAVPGPRRRWP